eukprot:1660802-Rhodomonas_salina.1
MDMLLTCKFAEGDSRILQQKLARDRLRALQVCLRLRRQCCRLWEQRCAIYGGSTAIHGPARREIKHVLPSCPVQTVRRSRANGFDLGAQKGGLGAMARAVLTAEGRAALRLARQVHPTPYILHPTP